MGETLAETRLAVEAQRAELQRTSVQLRESLDIRKRFRENPAPFIALGAAAAFVLVGGPGQVAGLVRRRFFPTNPEKAYDSLPRPMQAWVDHMAGAVGPRTGEARQVLSEELARWRSNPRKHGKINKKLARQIAEGPPGPKRAAWSAMEAGASIVVAALARKAVERLLAGEPGEAPALPPAGAATPARTVAAPATPRRGSGGATAKPATAEPDYSGISARDRS